MLQRARVQVPVAGNADDKRRDSVVGMLGHSLRRVEIRRGSCCCIVPPARVPDNAILSSALARAVRKLLTALRKSLTWDRCSELTDHAKFTVATDVKVYSCDPYCAWQ